MRHYRFANPGPTASPETLASRCCATAPPRPPQPATSTADPSYIAPGAIWHPLYPSHRRHDFASATASMAAFAAHRAAAEAGRHGDFSLLQRFWLQPPPWPDWGRCRPGPGRGGPALAAADKTSFDSDPSVGFALSGG